MIRRSVVYRVVRLLFATALMAVVACKIDAPGDILAGAEPTANELALETFDAGLHTDDQALSTPELIERAFARGEITEGEKLLYLAYAVYDYDSLPERFRSNVPWFGTDVVQELKGVQQAIDTGKSTAPSDLIKTEFERLLAPTAETICGIPDGPILDGSTNFVINYSSIGGGLSINDYKNALENAFSVEVTSYGWPKPPVTNNNPWGKYPVRAAALGGGLYGYVTSFGGSYTGLVGDNPNTTAVETEAIASCMVINSNYTGFPGGALNAVKVTAAHEHVHSIQFGVGDPGSSEDAMWYESTAMYMEDEVVDSANDNYHYLWPYFTSCLGEYSGGQYSEYTNWLFFRYAAEHNGGTNLAGGGEDIVETYWNNVAAGQVGLSAYNNALSVKGANLADTFHNYAIASRFMMSCPDASPFCYEEASAYVSAKGAVGNNGSISAIGGSYDGGLRNNYAINWIGLPTSGVFNVVLENFSSSGQFRVSVVAKVGSQLQVTPFPALVGGGSSDTLTQYQPPPGATAVVAVITNQNQTASNPSSCSFDSYRLSLSEAPPPVYYYVYIPIAINPVSDPGEGASGTVTDRGAPVSGTLMLLRYNDGSSWSTYDSTTTDSSGYYNFPDLPPLGSGQEFYIRWWNADNGYDPSRLWTWACWLVDSSSPTESYTCDFDLEDIVLLSPVNDASVPLPNLFTWQRRALTSDSYLFNLYDPDDGDPWYQTGALGYVGQYTLPGLPIGFDFEITYWWEPWVEGSDGYGVSYSFRLVTFDDGGFGPTMSTTGPPPQRPLDREIEHMFPPRSR